MTYDKAIEHLVYLKDLRTVYKNMMKDSYKSLYTDYDLKILIDKTNLAIEDLLELMIKMDTKDCYDQKKGEIYS